MVGFELRVHSAAYRHGVSHAEVLHAYIHAISWRLLDDHAEPSEFILIGADWAANLIEMIGTQKADGAVFIFHATRLLANHHNDLFDREGQ